MIRKQIESLELRIQNLSRHLIASKQKDIDAKRSLSIIIQRKKRLIKFENSHIKVNI